jgi:hypothetical protein
MQLLLGTLNIVARQLNDPRFSIGANHVLGPEDGRSDACHARASAQINHMLALDQRGSMALEVLEQHDRSWPNGSSCSIRSFEFSTLDLQHRKFTGMNRARHHEVDWVVLVLAVSVPPSGRLYALANEVTLFLVIIIAGVIIATSIQGRKEGSRCRAGTEVGGLRHGHYFCFCGVIHLSLGSEINRMAPFFVEEIFGDTAV